MFSANENIVLRQHKRRIVGYVEQCIPENVLDAGTTVMVMEVACNDPGCVPMETIVIIVFPQSSAMLLPGLQESQGGSYRTKILKPMVDVTEMDVHESLPPMFVGGLRTPSRLAISARDALFGLIAQLTPISSSSMSQNTNVNQALEERRAVVECLRQSLQEYLDHDCVPPPAGEPYPDKNEVGSKAVPVENNESSINSSASQTANESSPTSLMIPIVVPLDQEKLESEIEAMQSESMEAKQSFVPSQITTTKGNVVIRRKTDDDIIVVPIPQRNSHDVENNYISSAAPMVGVDTVVRQRQQQSAVRALASGNNNIERSGASNLLTRLYTTTEHAASGVRRAGCPCCDPDHPSNIVDQLMMQL
jgi:hypothetical protein